MRRYAVKEIFKTIQGEGHQAGSVAVFLRFAGCNLWSGREEDRQSAICRFCDTDFFKPAYKYTCEELVAEVVKEWGSSIENRLVVITGGEPTLQCDTQLVGALRACGFRVAVETNGTVQPQCDFDWVCVSPKYGSELVLTVGDELKVVVPQPFDFKQLRNLKFKHFFVQPMDGLQIKENTETAINFCLSNPEWRLSIQVHKLVGLR